MLPLQRVLPAAIVEIVRRQPTTPEKVDFAWKRAVGPAVARATTVSLEPDGTLVVAAADERWEHEIRQSLPTVRARLDTLLGDALVRVTVASSRS
jgi:hypothetical protein